MWVRGHSRSLKLVPFKTVSYSPSIVTMAVLREEEEDPDRSYIIIIIIIIIS